MSWVISSHIGCGWCIKIPYGLLLQLMKQLDYGKGYRYAHDEEGGFAAGERYLPDGMADPGFYEPVERGLEIKIAQKLRDLRERNAAADLSHPPSAE